MAKTWVLDTETKGTGAHIAPLPAKGPRTPKREAELALVQLARPPRPKPAQAEPTERQLRFKVVDVQGARVVGEDLGVRATVEALGQMVSALDARVYVWVQSSERWRLLRLAETRKLWQLARDASQH